MLAHKWHAASTTDKLLGGRYWSKSTILGHMNTYTRISSCWQTRTMHCSMVNVLKQTRWMLSVINLRPN